jgi:cytochrome c oxidase subunit 4
METTAHKHPNYVLIWVYLAVLTVVEVGVAFISHLPKTTLLIILLFLAVWKALLVALYFMHLKFERWNLRIIALIPVPLALILIILVLQEGL